QSERDKIIEKALNEYYYPAQSILSALDQDFSNRSEGAKIQDLFEELNLKMSDAIRSKGVSSGG
ncbi:MAG: hypothetical protein ABIH42_00515, partial [Planctomycetota bacterium]